MRSRRSWVQHDDVCHRFRLLQLLCTVKQCWFRLCVPECRLRHEQLTHIRLYVDHRRRCSFCNERETKVALSSHPAAQAVHSSSCERSFLSYLSVLLWRRLDHVRFMHCFAGARGAAVSCQGDTFLECSNVKISDCSAGESGGEGGAMFIANGVLTMADSRISNCVAPGRNSLGGGILSRGSSQLDLIRVILVDCSAERVAGCTSPATAP